MLFIVVIYLYYTYVDGYYCLPRYQISDIKIIVMMMLMINKIFILVVYVVIVLCDKEMDGLI